MFKPYSSTSFIELFILNTVAYFDLFEYPLTALELYQFLYTGGMEGSTYTYEEIMRELRTSAVLQKHIVQAKGLFFLRGRDELLRIREERYLDAHKKFKRAIRGARLLRLIPWIRLVAVCNNLANNNAKADSDIDILIITKKKRLYTVRALVTLVLSLALLRRHGRAVANRLCLSFYTTEENINFEHLQIPGKDIYLQYWIAQVFPLFEREDMYSRFVSANGWVRSALPHMQQRIPSYRRRVRGGRHADRVAAVVEVLCFGIVGDFFELCAKAVQRIKMSGNTASLADAPDSRVIISDTMLKFHENDRRAQYTEAHDRLVQTLVA